MTANQIRVAWFALLIGSAVIAITPVCPAFVKSHIVFLSTMLIGTAFAINGFRRLGESDLERDFWCVLIGLSISFAMSLFSS